MSEVVWSGDVRGPSRGQLCVPPEDRRAAPSDIRQGLPVSADGPRLPHYTHVVLAAVRAQPGTVAELAARVGLSIGSVRHRVDDLVRLRLVVGDGKRGFGTRTAYRAVAQAGPRTAQDAPGSTRGAAGES